ncbi:hypothetical protein J5N97_006437 [Dioscorea zingiberensis]|uniref:Rapid ALkalinization Factor n=1 Tax=Dioscorea zingiberensis TaxID=325984 RepID=A0A9D5HTM4_9LILI|nr:hypothetical protein J5N97_006437 [Dioscorea zingiberensis]
MNEISPYQRSIKLITSMAPSTTSKAMITIFFIIFTILLQLFITTPAFAASVDVPNIGRGRALDPNHPVCNRGRGLPCRVPVKPTPGRGCEYHKNCYKVPPAQN